MPTNNKISAKGSCFANWKIHSFFICLISCGSLLLLFACEKPIDEEDRISNSKTISEYIEENATAPIPKYSKSWELLKECNLDNTLRAYNRWSVDGYTFFMPTDEAFERYIENHPVYNSFDDMLADKAFINVLMRYHLLNGLIASGNFPLGALPDTTTTGDYLTIGFLETTDSIIYLVNNDAPIIKADIELSNGYIHVIDKVLEPVYNSSYDWLILNKGFTIFTEALEITGLKDTLNTSIMRHTILAVPDSIYAKYEIFSIQDLISYYQTSSIEVDKIESEFYQNMAFHILETELYLDNLKTGNYNTYSNFPISIVSDLELKLNSGTDTLDIIISGQDTTIINYVRIMMESSNISTINGSIHLIRDLLHAKNPGRTTRTFEFLEDVYIAGLGIIPDEYIINKDYTNLISWTGVDEIRYVKSGSSISAQSNDYLSVSGNFTISYTIPKLLPGNFRVSIKADVSSSNNATVQVYIDGVRVGNSLDLTVKNRDTDTFEVKFAGNINFLEYKTHVVEIKSIASGSFLWDFIRFEPY
ncbi:MAG: fasciclin domain-containing protein [Bacteroidales bacterium]|nr:fasciclin domain-containing protein [Bacteroidales bacterium]MCF8389348.1 fasciclin domain-containing protein [Bacteroidales bacterium]